MFFSVRDTVVKQYLKYVVIVVSLENLIVTAYSEFLKFQLRLPFTNIQIMTSR